MDKLKIEENERYLQSTFHFHFPFLQNNPIPSPYMNNHADTGEGKTSE